MVCLLSSHAQEPRPQPHSPQTFSRSLFCSLLLLLLTSGSTQATTHCLSKSPHTLSPVGHTATWLPVLPADADHSAASSRAVFLLFTPQQQNKWPWSSKGAHQQQQIMTQSSCRVRCQLRLGRGSRSVGAPAASCTSQRWRAPPPARVDTSPLLAPVNGACVQQQANSFCPHAFVLRQWVFSC